MTNKTITLKQIGWLVTGTVEVSFWGGGEGIISMDDTEVPIGKMTKDNLHRCINDGQFGVEGINKAMLVIYKIYNGFCNYSDYYANPRTIVINKPNPELYSSGI